MVMHLAVYKIFTHSRRGLNICPQLFFSFLFFQKDNKHCLHLINKHFSLLYFRMSAFFATACLGGGSGAGGGGGEEGERGRRGGAGLGRGGGGGGV